MPQFRRRLPEAAVRRMSESARDHAWFGDLLRRWRPSGYPLDEGSVSGLRLAIRDNYLSFYRHGQSVARVGFDRSGNPRADVHNKYVYAEGAGRSYVRLQNGHFPAAIGSNLLVPYDAEKLAEWIAASERHSGAEKRFVEAVVAVSPNVVDLEMGLPAFSIAPDQRAAPRMDLVAIEHCHTSNLTQIVFWEAKGASDGRARCAGDTPEVVHQLRTYERWLAHGQHKRDVVDAYISVCRLMMRLRAVAVEVGASDLAISAEIRSVAENGHNLHDRDALGPEALRVGVELKPRLLIDNYGEQASSSFESNDHLVKLTAAPHNLAVHVVRKQLDLLLPSLAD